MPRDRHAPEQDPVEGAPDIIIGKSAEHRLSVFMSHRVVLTPLVTHRFRPEQIADADELFGNRRDGVLKVAITP